MAQQEGPLMVNGRLIVDPREKLQSWTEHYRGLHDDVTGHSRDALFWEREFPAPTPPGINRKIDWDELNETLRSLKRGKAPGLDGIPYELCLTARENPHNEHFNATIPASELGKFLLFLVNVLFTNGYVQYLGDGMLPRWYRYPSSKRVMHESGTTIVGYP